MFLYEMPEEHMGMLELTVKKKQSGPKHCFFISFDPLMIVWVTTIVEPNN